VIAATASEAPHVLDGLLDHRSGLGIAEHFTDTGGATDHVFGMPTLLGFGFAPRLRDIRDRRLHILPRMKVPPLLGGLAGDAGKVDLIEKHCSDWQCRSAPATCRLPRRCSGWRPTRARTASLSPCATSGGCRGQRSCWTGCVTPNCGAGRA